MGLRKSASTCLLLVLLASGCAEPPNKEMDQAQGAIDAAQAAGADTYATSEYFSATEALNNANIAVTDNDHRLALSYALESREHAKNAARNAADAKARVRVEVDHASTELAALLAESWTILDAVGREDASRAQLEQVVSDLTAAETRLQEAGEAVEMGDYLNASVAFEGARTQIEDAMTQIRGTLRVPSSRD